MPDCRNISSVAHKCYGCGVCTRACPRKCISLKENARGFYSPVVNDVECVDCGLCISVCSFINPLKDIGGSPAGYYGWSANPTVRQWCSSGGVAYEAARFLFERGYSVCTVKYDVKDGRAKHYVVDSIDSIKYSVGSKYIPSYTQKAFGKINTDGKWVVIGSPCQIASFRRYLRLIHKEDNFVLLDFFCHGVPSLKLWDKYLAEMRGKIGDTSFVSWRTKRDGWHDSWAISADNCAKDSVGERYDIDSPEPCHTIYSKWTTGDIFYRFFLGNYCLNSCCYKDCKFKGTHSEADIRLGDYWGQKFQNDQQGVSAVISFTEKGKALMCDLRNCCVIQTDSVDEILKGQLTHSMSKPWIYRTVLRAFDSNHSLEWIYRNVIERFYYNTLLPQRIYSKIKRVLGK